MLRYARNDGRDIRPHVIVVEPLNGPCSGGGAGAGADHLKALARVARVLRNQAVLEQIRKIRDPEMIYALLTESAAQAA